MKKILWVTNTIFPDAAINLGVTPPVYGGWMYGLASDLAKSRDINLAVATVYSGKEVKFFEVNDIRYYLIPQRSQIDKMLSDWRTVNEDFAPDLVHIHGTEYGHGLALMNACPNLKYVISLQGLVSVYHRYFLAGMSTWDVLRNITFRDIIRWDSLFNAKNNFYKQGLIEKEYIRRANAVVGRTDWDHAHTLAINPKVTYYFCNESLRNEFYTDEKWSLKKCRRHSIFLSQAGYPIKGMHQVIKAVALLKAVCPDILVEVAGHDITKTKTLKDRLKRGGYGRFIKSLLKTYRLEKHIKFLGPLQAEEMKKAYLRSHVFICPSSIENSPNSLGEAQILGVPCIASYCGGVPSMVKDKESAMLYRYEEHEMLALNLKELFNSKSQAENIAHIGKIEATIRHDRAKNLDTIISIYSTIIQ
jgi:glycosyltransferase involved in cell wall biosynthesis